MENAKRFGEALEKGRKKVKMNKQFLFTSQIPEVVAAVNPSPPSCQSVKTVFTCTRQESGNPSTRNLKAPAREGLYFKLHSIWSVYYLLIR